MTTNSKTPQAGYNTTDLSDDLAKHFGYTKAQAARIVAATFTLVGNAVAEGKLVRIHSFGNFKPIAMSERQGRNPQTGEVTTIPASIRPHFTAGQNLKDKVRTGTVEKLEDDAQTAPKQAPAPKPAQKQAKQAPAPKAAKPQTRKASPAPVVDVDADDISDIADL